MALYITRLRLSPMLLSYMYCTARMGASIMKHELANKSACHSVFLHVYLSYALNCVAGTTQLVALGKIYCTILNCVSVLCVAGMFTHTFAREFKSWCFANSRRTQQRLAEASTRSKVRKLVLRLTKHDANIGARVPSKLSQQANSAYAVVEPIASCSGDVIYASNGSTSTGSSGKMSVKRQITPPHIAQGMGQKDNFEKYFLIWLAFWKFPSDCVCKNWCASITGLNIITHLMYM